MNQGAGGPPVAGEMEGRREEKRAVGVGSEVL